MKSIRAHLLVRLLALFTLSWVVIGGYTYYEARHEVEELFDAKLAQGVGVLSQIQGLNASGAHIVLDREVYGHKYEKKIAFQIWAGSELVLRSANAPLAPMSDSDGYSDREIDGMQWRVFRFSSSPELTVYTGERHDVRDELTNEITWKALYPITLALPVLALLIWYGVGNGLAPLNRIASTLSERSPGHLEAVQLEDEPPSEVRPLVDSVNNLFERLESAFEREQRFTSDAAHELRTPLASLRTQAQVALRTDKAPEREHALRQIIQGVDRTTHLVQQLLTLARLDPELGGAELHPVRLRFVAADVLSELAGSAVDKGIELSLEGEDVVVLGTEGALRVLIRNLVDNAIRYTPHAGEVTVEIKTDTNGQVTLVVSDTGPGLDPVEQQQVFERFYRGKSSDNTSGVGLGLSIIKRIAQLHHANVKLENTERGLRAKVSFTVAGATTT